MILFGVFLLQTAFAECEKSVTNKEFGEALDVYCMGFVSKNPAVLHEQYQVGKDMIPCLSEPISQDLAHRFHLLNGLYH